MNSKDITAVILSGGLSSRMGTNKSLLKIGNVTMLEHIISKLRGNFREIIVVTDEIEEYSFIEGIRFVKDCINTKERNSLVGIHAGLVNSKTPYAFVIACDMPLVSIDMIHYMTQSIKSQDIIVPYIDGYYQPLYAIYKKTCIPHIEELLYRNWYRIFDFYGEVDTKLVLKEEILPYDYKLECFVNVNTREEFDEVKNKISN